MEFGRIIISETAMNSDNLQDVINSNISVINLMREEGVSDDLIHEDALTSYYLDYYYSQYVAGNFAQFVHASGWNSELNELIEEAIEKQPHPSFRGHPIKIKYSTQLPLPYPAFALFCNYPEEVKENYRNFLENQIRAAFPFTGAPIRIFFRQK